MAARLCDFAKGIEVLIPTMQLERLPEGAHAKPFGEVELRGFPGPIDVVSLTGTPQPASVDASDLWTRSPFI
jgi:class 3 adenylate cyclase